MQKISVRLLSAVCAGWMAFGVYGCGNDENDYLMEEPFQLQSSVMTRGMSVGYSLVDSVAMSDELWEFKEASDRLAQKFDAYADTLSDEEWEELEAHIEDDDYMEALHNKVDMEKEMRAVDEALDALYTNTGFTRLSEQERSELFAMLAQSNRESGVKPLKVREESERERECKRQRDKAYAEAEKNYYEDLSKCQGRIDYEKCKAQAASRRRIREKAADKQYKACIEGI